MGFIYKATYRVSGKAYIGQTIQTIEKRMLQHQYPSSGCKAFLAAINKHGWENFDVDWYECPDAELNDLEEFLVDALGTLAPGGYNLRRGGGSRGEHSDVTKQKMREAWTPERKKKMSEANSGEKHPMYGKNHIKESTEKMSAAKMGEKHPMYGKNHTKESKEKMSAAHLGKTLTKEHRQKIGESNSGAKNHNSKTVYRYNLDGTFIDDFVSGVEAARALDKEDGSTIRKCACGVRKTAFGFRWSREKMDRL
jgi:group I intron endonuclease